MKHFSSLHIAAAILITGLLSACSSDNSYDWDSLNLSQPISILRKGEGGSIKFSGGSSDYTVTNTNPNVASVEIETSEYAVRFDLQMIYINALTEGSTVVSVVDNVTGSSIALTIKVSQPYIGSRTSIGGNIENENEVFHSGTYLYFFKDGRFLLYNDPEPNSSIFALDGTNPEIEGEYALGEDNGEKYITFSYITAHQITYKFYLRDNDAYEYLTTWPETDYDSSGWEDSSDNEWQAFTIRMVSAYDDTRALYLADSYIRLPYNAEL